MKMHPDKYRQNNEIISISQPKTKNSLSEKDMWKQGGSIEQKRKRYKW